MFSLMLSPYVAGGYPPNQQPGPYGPGPQQPYGPSPYGQPPGQTTVVVQPTPMIVQAFRETPVQTRCPHCQADVVTGTTYESGSLTWVACVALCVFGCDLGCCLIPFCVDSCKDVVHHCPNCQQVIARFNRL